MKKNQHNTSKGYFYLWLCIIIVLNAHYAYFISFRTFLRIYAVSEYYHYNIVFPLLMHLLFLTIAITGNVLLYRKYLKKHSLQNAKKLFIVNLVIALLPYALFLNIIFVDCFFRIFI